MPRCLSFARRSLHFQRKIAITEVAINVVLQVIFLPIEELLFIWVREKLEEAIIFFQYVESLDDIQIDSLLNTKLVVEALYNALNGLLNVLVVNKVGS